MSLCVTFILFLKRVTWWQSDNLETEIYVNTNRVVIYHRCPVYISLSLSLYVCVSQYKMHCLWVLTSILLYAIWWCVYVQPMIAELSRLLRLYDTLKQQEKNFKVNSELTFARCDSWNTLPKFMFMFMFYCSNFHMSFWWPLFAWLFCWFVCLVSRNYS